MTERFESNETVYTRTDVIGILKQWGNEEPHAHEILLKYEDKIQARANQENTATANVRASIHMAEIYYESGYRAEALDLLYSLYELQDECLEEIETLINKCNEK